MSRFPDPAEPTSGEHGAPRLRQVLAMLIGAALVVAVWVFFFSDSDTSRPDLTVSWTQNSVRVREDVGVVELTARLSEPAGERLVIELATRGTASIGEDFRLATASIEFAQGEELATITIEILEDEESGEDRESVMVQLVASQQVRVARPDTFSIVIEDPRLPGNGPEPTQPPVVPSTTVPSTTATSTTEDTQPPARSLGELGVRSLTEGAAQGAASVSLAPFTIEPDVLVLLIVSSASSSAPTPVPVVTDELLAFEVVETSTRNDGPRRITMFRAASGAGGTSQPVVDLGRQEEVIDWVVMSVENAPIDENGAAAVLQTGASAADVFEVNAAVPLGPLQSDSSITIGGFFIGANRAEGVEGFETIAAVGPAKRLLLAIVGADPLVATADWPTKAHWIGVAAEIANQ